MPFKIWSERSYEICNYYAWNGGRPGQPLAICKFPYSPMIYIQHRIYAVNAFHRRRSRMHVITFVPEWFIKSHYVHAMSWGNGNHNRESRATEESGLRHLFQCDFDHLLPLSNLNQTQSEQRHCIPNGRGSHGLQIAPFKSILCR